MKTIRVKRYSTNEKTGRFIVDLPWDEIDPDQTGPTLARVEMIPTDGLRVAWLGVAYGVPIFMTTEEIPALLRVGDRKFSLDEVDLEGL